MASHTRPRIARIAALLLPVLMALMACVQAAAQQPDAVKLLYTKLVRFEFMGPMMQQIDMTETHGILKVYPKLIAQVRSKADAGDADAQKALGALYAGGQGVPQDETEAAIWYRKAADQGDAEAQATLCLLYTKGQGVPKDYAQADIWCHKSNDQGDMDAVRGLRFLQTESAQ